jgi:hypothetical protein
LVPAFREVPAGSDTALAALPYEVARDQFGALIVWEYSAENGSRLNIREYPVHPR